MNGLIEQLTELRLHGMAEAAKDLIAAKSTTSLPEALRQLIQAERCERDVRSVQNRMRAARFPHTKTSPASITPRRPSRRHGSISYAPGSSSRTGIT